MKKIKIILLTLPVPEFYDYYQKGNHQLFNDYFTSFLKTIKGSYNINNFEIIKLPKSIIDNFNNRGIIKVILELKPDIVGFSSYLWNIERNIYISKQLQKYGIITVAGGPDIQIDNEFIFRNKSFDYFIIGEGEYKLLYLLQTLLPHKLKKRYLKSSNYKIIDDSYDNITHYHKLKQLFSSNYNKIILNYIDITDDYKIDKLFYIETERGCPFSCSFCAYSKFRKDIISINHKFYKKIFQKILTKNIQEVYILSPTLNRNKINFEFLLNTISELLNVNNLQAISFFGELRSEFLKDKDIELLSKANFREIEFGIQSLKKEVLKKLNRNPINYNLKEFVKKLEQNNIKPIIDFIIGLPDESYNDIIQTIDYLDNNDLIKYSSFYHLLLLPSTELKFNFQKKDYIFAKTPPYFAIKTNKLDIQKIKNIYMYLESEKDISYYDEFIFTNKDKIYITQNLNDLKNLNNTLYYQTANYLFIDNFLVQNRLETNTIINFYNDFFNNNPEIFHILYIITFKKIDFSFYKNLKEIFISYKNYYDKFHESINYFNDELFSKRIEILTSIEVYEKHYKNLNFEFNINFVYFDTKINQFIKDYKTLEQYYYENGNYTYIIFLKQPIKFKNYNKYLSLEFVKAIRIF